MSNNQEIDLIEIIVKIFNFFKKYLILFVIAIILGIVVGFFKSRKSSTTYKSSMLITSGIKSDVYKQLSIEGEFENNNLIPDLIGYLNLQIQNADYQNLANKLNLDVAEVSKIISISVDEKEFNEKLKASFSQNFLVTAEVVDNEIFKKLADAIKYYISNNLYVKNIGELQKKSAAELLDKLNVEIYKIDSIRNSINNQKNSNFIIYNLTENNSISAIQLYKSKMRILNNLELSEPVYIIEDFYNSSATTISSKKTLYIIPILLLIFAGIFAIIREINILAKKNK